MAFTPSIAALVAFLICLAGIAVLWILVARQPRADVARCGACGYAVEGLETMSCPECGADFRKVGIRTAQARLMRPTVFLVAWTLLLPLPAMIVSALASELMPRTQRWTSTLYVRPASGSFSQVTLHLDVESSARPFVGRGGTSISTRSDGTTTTSTMTFPAPSTGDRIRSAEVRVERPGATVTSVAPGTPAPGPAYALPSAPSEPIDEPAMARWLAANGQTVGGASDPGILALDAADLAGLARAAIDGTGTYTTTRLVSSGTATSGGVSRLPWWWTAGVATLWLLLYGLGIALFFAVRRKRRVGVSR